MDRYTLRLFLHLSESLHFGRTGQECNISPSALSRQIQRLEDEVGHPLFERDNRRVRLTEAGSVFRDYARDVVDKWQAMQAALAHSREELEGEISIYCSVTASLSILPELLGNFKTAYPNVHIRLQTGDAGNAVRKVSAGEVDLAVAALPDRLPGSMEFKILTRVSLAFIAPKGEWEFSSAIGRRIAWEKIPMILSQRGLARKRVDDWFRQRKIRPRIYAQVSGNEAILSMVSLGCGVGVVPGLVLENSPVQNRVTHLNVRPEVPPYDVGICVQRRKLKSLLVRAFFEMENSFA
jgi:LysR family positive regulator for ilvC